MSKAVSATKKRTFDEDMQQLEQLVQKIEQADLSLDDVLKHFEQGMVLAKRCQKQLDDASVKIEKITTKHALQTPKGNAE